MKMIRELLAVGIGCAMGAIMRFLLGVWLRHGMIDALAICIVNLLGCFLMGLLTSVIEARQPATMWAKMMTTGFCGGLTTFSTCCSDTVLLLRASPILALGIMLVSLTGGMALYIVGRRLVHVPHDDVV